MEKITKEKLQKQNAILEDTVAHLRYEDERIRGVFCDLLDSAEFVQEYGFSSSEKRKVVLRSWEGIAFLIGELKSNADYSCAIQAREDLKREVAKLSEKIHFLEHPEKSCTCFINHGHHANDHTRLCSLCTCGLFSKK